MRAKLAAIDVLMIVLVAVSHYRGTSSDFFLSLVLVDLLMLLFSLSLAKTSYLVTVAIGTMIMLVSTATLLFVLAYEKTGYNFFILWCLQFLIMLFLVAIREDKLR